MLSTSTKSIAAMLVVAVGIIVGTESSWGNKKLTIKGSDTMVVLNRELAKMYMDQHPDVHVKVTGGGSGKGINALFKNDVDISASSRPLKAKEIATFEKKYGAKPFEIPIALDGIGIYVHDNNPVMYLTLSQLRKIYTGEITNWKEVGGYNRPIAILNRNKFSGTRAFFKEHALDNKDFTKHALEVETTEALTEAVSRYQTAIGYGGIAYARGVHVLKIIHDSAHEAIWPSIDAVAKGHYPLSRKLYFYVNPASNCPDLAHFVQWVLSDQGQEKVASSNYYPLIDKMRILPDTLLALVEDKN